MRVSVVSDVHGNAAALAKVGADTDVLICLGDLILFLDYDDPGGGIFAELFGAHAAARLITLRTERRFEAAREFSAGLWSGIDDRRAVIEDAVRRQYAELFAAMPDPTYLTYGNVDVPTLWPEFLRDGIHVLDGAVTEIAGRRVGFVGGGLKTPMHTPFEITDEQYAAKVEALGQVDVLCCHIPPDIPELLYDTEARRLERGSRATLDAIVATQPELVLFGHVHNPLVGRRRIGRSECVNVGHFHSRGTAYQLDW